MTKEELVQEAFQAMKNAYAPYSNYHVGACVLARDGRTFYGANIENASFGATICAERCAASCAVAAGQRRFMAVAIAANTAAWPCGICRQVLREFSCGPEMPVIVGPYDGDFTVKTLEELLPDSFGPEYLL